METKEAADNEDKKGDRKIKVEVRFPISTKGAFSETFKVYTLVGAVRERALKFFEIAEDGQHAYYLTHKSKRLDDNSKLGDIDNKAKELKLTLVKELIQG